MITVHAYKTWQGETRVCIAHSAGSMPAENGRPGVRTTLLNEQEARELLSQLTAGLAAPHCAEANKEEADAD